MNPGLARGISVPKRAQKAPKIGHLCTDIEENALFFKDMGVSGGAVLLDLEPADASKLLSELEDWNDILRGEPEVLLKLAAFAEVAGTADNFSEEPETPDALPAPEVSP